jgi:type IX secretion system PorP/SprF family membrane protein
MRKSVFIGILIIWPLLTEAQQVATYSQYMFNGLAINPAYAGSHDVLSATALARFQNVGLPGAPNTQTFTLHSPLRNKKVGLGLLAIHDKLSVIDQTGVHISYAYRLPVTQKSTLAFGLQAGYSWYRARYTELELFNNPDPVFNQDVRESRPNIGAGIFYSTRMAYFGISMPHLLNNVFERGEDINTVYQNKPLIITGGYVFTLNQLFKLKPNFLFKVVDGRPVEFDVNANLLFDEIIWVGLSYKSSRQAVLLTDLQLTDQIRFGYSYTITAGHIRVVELGSHEVMLNYRFKYNKKSVVTPRYF